MSRMIKDIDIGTPPPTRKTIARILRDKFEADGTATTVNKGRSVWMKKNLNE